MRSRHFDGISFLILSRAPFADGKKGSRDTKDCGSRRSIKGENIRAKLHIFRHCVQEVLYFASTREKLALVQVPLFLHSRTHRRLPRDDAKSASSPFPL